MTISGQKKYYDSQNSCQTTKVIVYTVKLSFKKLADVFLCVVKNKQTKKQLRLIGYHRFFLFFLATM